MSFYDVNSTYPYFTAVRNTSITTGISGTDTIITWDLVPFNIGSSFNGATGIYTAPLNGIYHFSISLGLSNGAFAAASSDPMAFGFRKVSGGVNTFYLAPDNWRYSTNNPSSYISASYGATIPLNSGDTVNAMYTGITSTGGITIYGPSTIGSNIYYHSNFTGYLVTATV
jgi:hypothetical protein